MSRADKRLARLEEADARQLSLLSDAELAQLAAGVSPTVAAQLAAMTDPQIEQAAAGHWPDDVPAVMAPGDGYDGCAAL